MSVEIEIQMSIYRDQEFVIGYVVEIHHHRRHHSFAHIGTMLTYEKQP